MSELESYYGDHRPMTDRGSGHEIELAGTEEGILDDKYDPSSSSMPDSERKMLDLKILKQRTLDQQGTKDDESLN